MVTPSLPYYENPKTREVVSWEILNTPLKELRRFWVEQPTITDPRLIQAGLTVASMVSMSIDQLTHTFTAELGLTVEETYDVFNLILDHNEVVEYCQSHPSSQGQHHGRQSEQNRLDQIRTVSGMFH